MNTQVTEGPVTAEQLYTTYGACLHQAAATHKDSGEFFRFSFDDAVRTQNGNNTLTLSLYEMYFQGLYEWRAKWEAAGERPPCLEADPTPFIMEEEKVAEARASELVEKMQEGSLRTRVYATQAPGPAPTAYAPPTIVMRCPDPTAANAVETVRRFEILANGEQKEVPVTREYAEVFVKAALAALEKGRKV